MSWRKLEMGVPFSAPASNLRSMLDRRGLKLAGLLSSRGAPDERFCRELTRREAANFYWGFLALPHDQRIAIYALYSFSRQLDDAVDRTARSTPGELSAEEAERFERHRERVRGCYAQEAGDPVMRVLSRAVARYGIPETDLLALVEGVEMDLRISAYASWEALSAYCDKVASAVGRMCVRIFGFSDPAALRYADDLGLAMQLTNILRDVREDAAMGRVYLPQDELARFGVRAQSLGTWEVGPEWEPLVRFEIERAHELFQSGLNVTRFIPRRAAACVLTMSGIYRAILLEIERDPYLPLSRRASLSGTAKLGVMLKSWLHAA